MTVRVQLVPAVGVQRPVGVVASGSAARALVQRVLNGNDDAMTELRGVFHEHQGVLLLGPEAALPWVDGVTYLCRSADAPKLMWPSASEFDVEPAVLVRALKRRFPEVPWPAAWVPHGDGHALWPVGHALPLSRSVLADWLAGSA